MHRVLSLLIMLSLSGAPQGVTVQVSTLELRSRATRAEAELVSSAVVQELTAQGYELRTDKAQALISGSLDRSDQGWRVHLTLVRSADQLDLDDVTLNVGRREELAKAGTEGARSLARSIRMNWGVRARVK
jgi:pyruvate/2-oxoglutarate dehydrogenase complex dihydrolipoamide dehydrogenase (E3) component